jgi:sec-independent protein translocase protein TatB
MFDIGASELFVIGVVALIVIGPERLPRVAKTLGHLFGRMQRYVADVKSDINREIELDELRKLKSTMQDAARSIEQSVATQVNFIESEVKQAGTELEKQAEEAVAPMRGIQLMPSAETATAPEPAPAPSAETLSADAVAGQVSEAPAEPAPAPKPDDKQA